MAIKTIYSAEYRQLVEWLRTCREEAELTQTALARQLGWPQQRVSAVEAGARRLDVMEFLHLTAGLGLSAEAAMTIAIEVSQSVRSKTASPVRR